MHFEGSRAALVFASLLCTARLNAADLSQAVVRERINIVTVAANASTTPRAAQRGAIVRDANIVRTGGASRAELEFIDTTIARLGSNSVFSFEAAARAMNFIEGAVLFSKPTNSGSVELHAGPITAAITGSTGFVSNRPISGVKTGKAYSSIIIIGMIEGHLSGVARWTDSQGQRHSRPIQLGPGELLIEQPARPPMLVQFDLARLVRTSPLLNQFNQPLPNHVQVGRAAVEYRADAARGLVQPLNQTVANQPLLGSNNLVDAGVRPLATRRPPGRVAVVVPGG